MCEGERVVLLKTENYRSDTIIIYSDGVCFSLDKWHVVGKTVQCTHCHSEMLLNRTNNILAYMSEYT